MIAGRSGSGLMRPVADHSMVRLVVYQGAYHSFDLPDLRFIDGFRAFGHWLAYDDAATRDCTATTRNTPAEQALSMFQRAMIIVKSLFFSLLAGNSPGRIVRA